MQPAHRRRLRHADQRHRQRRRGQPRRDPNPYGHIIRWRETRRRQHRTDVRLGHLPARRRPAYDPAVDARPTSRHLRLARRALASTRDGRVWIQTDISNSSQNLAEPRLRPHRQQPDARRRPAHRRGPPVPHRPARLRDHRRRSSTPDQRTMFVNVQHPGEADHRSGARPTPANPRAVSNWPDFDPAGRPRSATVVIRKVDGGKVGTTDVRLLPGVDGAVAVEEGARLGGRERVDEGDDLGRGRGRVLELAAGRAEWRCGAGRGGGRRR